MFDVVMKRYGISSYAAFLRDWNRGQLLIALDALYWNEPKERSKYGHAPIELVSAKASQVFAMMGFGALM